MQYKNYNTLLEEYSNYKSPKAKITNLIKSGKLIKVKRDLLISGDINKLSLNTVANILYGPSYISFEYALSYHGLIPERAEVITSATFGKNKNRIYHTPLGVFEYRRLNRIVYPYGILRFDEQDAPFLMASKEKALCDSLSKMPSVGSVKSMVYLLFDDLRIDRRQMLEFNINDVEFYSGIYHQTNIKLLYKLLLKEKKHE